MRYVDADWIIQKLERWRDQLAETYGENDEYVLCLGEVLMKLDDAPTADVRENVKGEWLSMFGHNVCNKCGFKIDIVPTNFCPNCGAEMRGEQDG